ncbi:MAG: hypothetical protein Fur0041_16410 [Bacteroidia bacterium]
MHEIVNRFFYSMKQLLIVLFFLFAGVAQAQIADSTVYHTLNGTKWSLVKEYRLVNNKKKGKPVYRSEKITFSGSEILFDLPDAHYACNFRMIQKNLLELECSQKAQFRYEIIKAEPGELIIDVWVKEYGSNEFFRRKRQIWQAA